MLLVSFYAHTYVGDQECLIPNTTMATVPGEKAAHKRLKPSTADPPPLLLAGAVTAAAAAVSLAFFFLGHVAQLPATI